MEQISPSTDAPHSTEATKAISSRTTILLGIVATLLALFVEYQLVRATDLRLGEPTAESRLESAMAPGSAEPRLQVRARSIDTKRRTSPVSFE
jgi:hypothetical protein